MKRRQNLLKCICLVILSFFIIEYLEPSTTGVRGVYCPSPQKAPRPNDLSPDMDESDPWSPHAMDLTPSPGIDITILNSAFRLKSVSPTLHPYKDPIYHPPINRL